MASIFKELYGEVETPLLFVQKMFYPVSYYCLPQKYICYKVTLL